MSNCWGIAGPYLGALESLSERARLLRQEDAGVLKVGATPQMIDGVFATFLHRYAKRYPGVQIKVTEAVGPDLVSMLERGELHLGIGSMPLGEAEDHLFGSVPLPAVEFLAVCHSSLPLGNTRNLEISRLARHPLLLLDPSFVVRTTFDAACRLAGFRPTVATVSRSPHTLLSLAEAGHGVAVVPSVLPTHRYRLRIFRLTHRRRPLQLTPGRAMGQATPAAPLRRRLLHVPRGVPARGACRFPGLRRLAASSSLTSRNSDEPRPAHRHCRAGDPGLSSARLPRVAAQ